MSSPTNLHPGKWLAALVVLLGLVPFLANPQAFLAQTVSQSPNNGGSNHQQQKGQNPAESRPVTAIPESNPAGDRRPIVSDQKATTDWWLVYFTAALVVVGLLQFIALLLHEHWMKKNVRIAQDSANAAVNIANTLKDTAVRQLRAYVFPNLAQRLHVGSGVFKIKVEVQNSGQTPAYNYAAFLAVGVFEVGTEPENLPLPPGLELSTGTLAPGDKLELGGLQQPLTPEQESAIRTGTHAIYVHGDVKYRDAFDFQRFTKFRLFCTGEWFDKGRFASCPDGNEAD